MVLKYIMAIICGLLGAGLLIGLVLLLLFGLTLGDMDFAQGRWLTTIVRELGYSIAFPVGFIIGGSFVSREKD